MITRAMSQKINQIEKQYTSDEINSALGNTWNEVFADVYIGRRSMTNLEFQRQSRDKIEIKLDIYFLLIPHSNSNTAK